MTDHSALIERFREHSESLKANFYTKYEADPNSGCWLWSLHALRHGYGVIQFRGKPEGAHRASYIMHKGEIPKGMCIMHSCDTKACVNPDHLELGTYSQNMKDAMARGLVPPKTKARWRRMPPHIISQIESMRGQSYHAIARVVGVNESSVRRTLSSEKGVT